MLLTLMFSAMISGSSQIDSTKKTCGRGVSETRSRPGDGSAGRPGLAHFVASFLGEGQDEGPPLSGGVGGVEDLQQPEGGGLASCSGRR